MNYRPIKIVGLCLASMLALGMALAGTASAATPLWLLCLEGSNANNTKYETNQCTKASGTGKWESVSLGGGSDTVRIVALTIRFTFPEGEPGGPVKITCDDVRGGSGLIENRNLLLIRELRVEKPSTECEAKGEGISKLCKTSNLDFNEGRHLPWAIEVYQETEHQFMSRIQPSGEGGGEPEWLWECGGRELDCSLGSYELDAENVITAGTLLVLDKFLKTKRHSGGCEVEGGIAILLSNGSGLSLRL